METPQKHETSIKDAYVFMKLRKLNLSDVEIDYSVMADEADQMALLGTQVEDEYDTRWVGGETWRNFPPVSFNNIWETNEPSIAQNSLTLSPKAGPKKNRGHRFGRNQAYHGRACDSRGIANGEEVVY